MNDRKPLDYYLELRYPVTVHEEETSFVAEVCDLPGCITQAETIEELWKHADDARRAWIVTAYEHGDDIPAPPAINRPRGDALVLEFHPTDDPEITCVVCSQPCCDLEACIVRRGERAWRGLHRKCLDTRI